MSQDIADIRQTALVVARSEPVYRTMKVARADTPPQRTSIGQVPGVVFVPTVHVHEADPFPSATFVPASPAAPRGPLA